MSQSLHHGVPFALQVSLTFMVFGGLAILAGLLTLLLPETSGAGMPETIEVRGAGQCSQGAGFCARHLVV